MYRITTLGRTEVSNQTFYKSEARNYGVSSYEKIVSYAAEHDIDLEKAGDVFGLSNDEKDYVKLMMARDLYKNGMIDQGNILLNRVAETPGKSEDVNFAMNEIRSKKVFYQHREIEKPKIKALVKPGRRTIVAKK